VWDMGPIHEPFLALVPAGGHILDAGCGPGRDLRAFLKRGYRVTAFDASAEMAQLASAYAGVGVAVGALQDLAFENAFDGIWACASLLHLPRAEMGDVVRRFTRALRPCGVWYLSFKRGEAEEIRGGRFYSDYTVERLAELLARHHDLVVVRSWQTSDMRAGREGEVWVNALVRKAGP